MNIKKIIIIFIISSFQFISTSCNQTQKDQVVTTETRSEIHKKEDSQIFSLLNTLYVLAPNFKEKDCEAYGECDCCSSNYLFLDKGNFICVDYCLEADTFYSGEYKIEKDKVTLKYNATVVQKEYNFEYETDTITNQPEYIYKTEKSKPFQRVWEKFNCEGKICFKSTVKETGYASVDRTQTSENFLNELKKEGVFERLNIK